MKFASITEEKLIFFKKKVIKTWLQKGKNNRRAYGPPPKRK